MAILQDGNIYIKLDSAGEQNWSQSDELWDDGVAGQIKQILLWHDEGFISGIQIIYEGNGKCLISKRHGGTQGNFETIHLKKTLTWLSGHYGSYCLDSDCFWGDEEEDPGSFCKCILSLKFGNEKETYGPFGCQRGTPFFFHGSNEIAGFHGSSSKSTTSRFGYISSIGPYIKTEAVGLIGQPTTPNGYVEKIKDEN